MDGTDNWVDSELARDIAIWRTAQDADLRSHSPNQQFEEYAIQVWFDDGGSSRLQRDVLDGSRR
jgi:hypothetical protein